MPDVEADDRTIDIKQKLRAAIAQSLPDGTYDDAVYAWIHALLGELTPRTPTPRPIDRQHFIGSPWGELNMRNSGFVTQRANPSTTSGN